MTQLVIDDLAVEVGMSKLNETPDLFPQPQPFIETVKQAQPLPSYNKDQVTPVARQRVYFRRDTGEQIGTTAEVSYKDKYVNVNGEEVNPEEILWLILKEDKYQRVRQYSKTKIIQGTFPIPMTAVSQWLPKTAYEIYVNRSKKYYNENEYNRMKAKLFAKAEEWNKQGKAMVGKYVFKEGSQPYVMVLFPYLKKQDNGAFQFVFVAFFSRTKLIYENLMDYVPTAVQQPVELLEEPGVDDILAAVAQ